MIVAGAASACAVLGGVAVYSPKDAVAAVIVVSLVALAFWRLTLGVAVFTILTFPEFLPGVLGAGATVAKPLGLVLAVAWVVTLAARNRPVQLLTRDHPALFWAVAAFVLLAAASAIWAPSFAETRYELQRLALAALLFLVVYTAAATTRAFRTIVWAYLVGSVVTSVYSIASGGYGSSGRLSTLFDPNYFAAELTPAIVVSCFLFLTTDSRRIRLVSAVTLVVDVIAFALTQSRGGIVGLAVGLIAAVAIAGRARPRVLAAVLVIFAVGVGYYFLYSPAHLSGSFRGSFASATSGRSDEWRIALRMFSNHPLNGVGLGNFVVVEPTYATQTINLNFVNLVVTTPLVAHNSYLEVAAELGFVGVLLFLAILALPTSRACRALPQLSASMDSFEFYARGVIAGALGLFVAFFFLSTEYEKQLWLVLGLLASISVLARKGTASSALDRS